MVTEVEKEVEKEADAARVVKDVGRDRMAVRPPSILMTSLPSPRYREKLHRELGPRKLRHVQRQNDTATT